MSLHDTWTLRHLWAVEEINDFSRLVYSGCIACSKGTSTWFPRKGSVSGMNDNDLSWVWLHRLRSCVWCVLYLCVCDRLIAYTRQSTQISTGPRATKQGRVKCRRHSTVPMVPTQGAIREEGG